MAAELDDIQAMWLELRAHVDELAGERQHYVDLFERASEAYVVTDLLGTIRDANGAAVDIFQRRKRYLRRKPFAVLLAFEHRPEFRRRIAALAARTGDAVRSWRSVVATPQGEEREVLLTTRLIEHDGVPSGISWRLDALV
ncbi:MAG: PAS domain S-box protein [Burkholderiales bacterium]